jgi:hypothetical protein
MLLLYHGAWLAAAARMWLDQRQAQALRMQPASASWQGEHEKKNLYASVNQSRAQQLHHNAVSPRQTSPLTRARSRPQHRCHKCMTVIPIQADTFVQTTAIVADGREDQGLRLGPRRCRRKIVRCSFASFVVAREHAQDKKAGNQL